MEFQHLFDIVVGLLFTVGGYLWKTAMREHKDLVAEVKNHREYALTNFAHKQDMKDQFQEIKEILHDIQKDLKEKVDKDG